MIITWKFLDNVIVHLRVEEMMILDTLVPEYKLNSELKNFKSINDIIEEYI